MEYSTFSEQWAMVEGNWPDRAKDSTRTAWWAAFSRTPDAIFRGAIRTVLESAEFLPRIATVHKAIKESAKHGAGLPNESIGAVFRVGETAGLHDGEIMILLNREYGWNNAKQIPGDRVDEVKDFLRTVDPEITWSSMMREQYEYADRCYKTPLGYHNGLAKQRTEKWLEKVGIEWDGTSLDGLLKPIPRPEMPSAKSEPRENALSDTDIEEIQASVIIRARREANEPLPEDPPF